MFNVLTVNGVRMAVLIGRAAHAPMNGIYSARPADVLGVILNISIRNVLVGPGDVMK